jgi:phosphoribosylformimino-5-aminoimidazole carboxamide ribotide isomerase
MLIIPAIDIMKGRVVRLVQGRRDEKVYSRDPLKTAQHWQRQGAEFLHIVDLDGAMRGKSDNLGLIKKIPAAVNIPAEIGGGIRTQDAIARMLDAGFCRVVLGTRAVEDPDFLKKAFKRFQEKVIVSVDAKGGRVMTAGWRSSSKVDAGDFARRLKEIGFSEIIYTDTLKDGTLKGPNVRAIKDLLKSRMQIIASGGISALADIRKLKSLEKNGLSGVIIGKALYEGKFTLSAALKLA